MCGEVAKRRNSPSGLAFAPRTRYRLVMRAYRARTAGAVLVAVLASGCAGQPSEEDSVKTTVTAWLGALVSKDSPRACAYLTPKLQRSIDSQLRTHSEPGSCRTWAGRWTFGATRPQGHRAAHVSAVRIDDGRATATVHAAPYEDSEVTLHKLGARWLIDNYN
jgi:hypothetical protein